MLLHSGSTQPGKSKAAGWQAFCGRSKAKETEKAVDYSGCSLRSHCDTDCSKCR